MSTPALETHGLHKSFGALTVANQIDFRLERGARHALIGPNGAGKTTFVELVTGALRPNAGHIRLDGADVTQLPQAARVKRGLVRTFQITALFRRLTALENVTLGIAEREGVADDLFWPSGRHKRVIEEAYAVLESLDLADDALRPVNMLAYGRQRLVEIAVSLALAPKVLLFDEPAAGVPSGESGTIIEVIERLPPEIALLIIGGVGRLYGAFIGVPLYMISQDRFSEVAPVYWYFWIGLLMVLVVVFARGGIFGLVGRLRR